MGMKGVYIPKTFVRVANVRIECLLSCQQQRFTVALYDKEKHFILIAKK